MNRKIPEPRCSWQRSNCIWFCFKVQGGTLAKFWKMGFGRPDKITKWLEVGLYESYRAQNLHMSILILKRWEVDASKWLIQRGSVSPNNAYAVRLMHMCLFRNAGEEKKHCRTLRTCTKTGYQKWAIWEVFNYGDHCRATFACYLRESGALGPHLHAIYVSPAP